MTDKSKQKRCPGRRFFAEEFHRDAARLVEVEGYSFARAAEAVGISVKSLRRWHAKYAVEPDACGDNATVQELQNEIQQLRQSELEKTTLKKPRCISRRSRSETRLERSAPRLFSYRPDVTRSASFTQRLLQAAQGRRQPAGAAEPPYMRRCGCGSPAVGPDLWQPQDN